MPRVFDQIWDWAEHLKFILSFSVKCHRLSKKCDAGKINSMDVSRRIFYGSWVILFITGTSVVWGVAIGLTLLIDHLGLKALPLAFLIEALLSIVFIVNIQKVRDWLPDGAVVALICLGGIGLLALGWLLVNRASDLGFGFYYAAQRIMRDLLLFYTWNYVASFYTTGSRHLLPRLALWSQVGVVLSGVSLFLLARSYKVEELVWLWGGALFLGMVAIGIFADEFQGLPRYKSSDEVVTSVTVARLNTVLRSLWNSELMRMLIIGAFSMMFLLNLMFYQIVDIFHDQFSEPESLLQWLSILSSFSSLLVLPVQYRLLPLILQRNNASKYAEVYPVAVGTAFVGVMVLPFVWMASLAEIVRTSLQDSLYDTLHNQMKHTLPASVFSWAHTFIEGLVEPAGRFLSACLLILLVTGFISPEGVVVAGVAAGLAFLYSQHRAGQTYQATLQKAIAAGQYSFLRANSQEQIYANREVEQNLLHRLREIASHDREILLITEALSETGSEAGFEALLQRWAGCPPAIQAELLRLLIEGWPRNCTGQAIQVLVAEALHSDHAELRLVALKAMVTAPILFDAYSVAQYLIHPDPSVSTLAAQLLLQHPKPPLAKAAHAQLNWLSRADSPSTRALAVNSMVQGGLNRFGQRVILLEVDRFQQDSSARVRMAVVAGVEGKDLLNSVLDVSPSVRHLALVKMAKNKRRNTTLLLQAIQDYQPEEPMQIHQTVRYWHLLTALATLNSRLGAQKVLPHIERGLAHIDYLTSLRLSIKELVYPSITALTAQLNNERTQMIQAFLECLTAVFGKAAFAPLVRTLQMQPDTPESEAALTLLGDMTSPSTAEKLQKLLTRPKDADIYITNDLARRIKTPSEGIADLLVQKDEWLPMVALYALSGLPSVLFYALAPPEKIEQVLERIRQSKTEAIRESARLIRQAMKDDFASTFRDTTLSRVAPSRKDSQTMLSTIERMLFLRNVSFFENLRLDQLRTLARICSELAVNQGEYLIHKGEAGDSLFIVVEGKIKIVDPSGDNVLAVLSSGEVLGEISLFDGGVRSADAIAETATLLLLVNRDALDDALADDPGIALDMLRVMALRIRESNKTLSRMSQKMNVSEIRKELQEIRKEMQQNEI